MNLALIFAIFCGIFVAAVLGLVMWLIATGLKEARHNKKDSSAAKENE
jgi:hypothetical protein